jgi:hypothetical protein
LFQTIGDKINFKRLSPVFYLAFLLNSCSNDALVPCENNGLKSGLLCREYLWYGNEVMAYYNYFYNSENQLVKKSLIEGNNKILKEEYYEFDSSGKLIEMKKHDPNNTEDTTFLYSYHFFDSLANKLVYINNTLLYNSEYSYDENNYLSGITNYKDDTVYSFTKYTYLSDYNPYQITNYLADSSIQSYIQYIYYTNDMIKVSFYDESSLLHYQILEYNEDTLKKISEYDHELNLNAYYLYDYDDYQVIQQISYYNEYDEFISSHEYTYYH